MRSVSIQIVALSLLVALAAGGCFRQVHEQVMEDSAAFIVVEGSGAPVKITIDGGVVAERAPLRSDNGVRYRVQRGTHVVRVERGDQVLADRKIYVGDGETRILTVSGN